MSAGFSGEKGKTEPPLARVKLFKVLPPGFSGGNQGGVRGAVVAIVAIGRPPLHAPWRVYSLRRYMNAGYELQLAGDAFKSVVDESTEDTIVWRSGDGRMKQVRLPRMIFVR